MREKKREGEDEEEDNEDSFITRDSLCLSEAGG